jgi:uncharacterized membrane protein YccC
MLKHLSYRTTRALHICTVFSVAILIEYMLKIPRGAWVAFTVILIYAAFDVGTSVQRIWHRFWGVLLGLFLAHFFWFVGHLNYRTLLLIVAGLLCIYYYLLGKPYMQTTVFTTILSVVGSDYFASTNFYLQWYFRDYFMCTLFAVIICVFFEYFIFKRVNMTRKFYVDFQRDLISQLNEFLAIIKRPKINKKDFLNAVVAFNKKIAMLNTFTQNTKHDYHNKDNLIAELEEFNQYVIAAYQKIRKIFVLHPNIHTSHVLVAQTQGLIQQLEQLVKSDLTP